MMNTAICTLFEGNYHHGLVGLVNSLVQKKFRGDIYAGYRGALPDWANSAVSNDTLGFEGGKTLNCTEEVNLHFVPLTTDYHFTNYKPDFMLELWDGHAQAADAMVYVDPDIVVTDAWSSFERWLDCGVALCEDVNSPVSQFHPRRVGWRDFYAKRGVILKFKEAFYVNGGFVGVKKPYRSFVEDWKRNQELMSDAIGGLKRSSLAGQQLHSDATGVFAPFGKTDQDALNATIESSDHPVSIGGKEIMGFIPGKALLPHALGTPKPWDNKPLKRAFNGFAPRLVDKSFWHFAKGAVQAKSNSEISKKLKFTRWASFIGRFYNRY